MTKGSPEGYNAETGSELPAQKPQTGEPNERQPLYRIRCTQEKHQLLRKDRRRADCRGRQAASDARRTAAVGREASGAVARGDGSNAVQLLLTISLARKTSLSPFRFFSLQQRRAKAHGAYCVSIREAVLSSETAA